MSSNQKICGLSYKVSSLVGANENDKYAYVNNVTNNEFNDNDDLFGFLYDNKDIKDKWVLTSDYDNNIGWVYITDTGESYGDIEFKMSLGRMTELAGILGNMLDEEIAIDYFNSFAIDYYNGSDCPFKF